MARGYRRDVLLRWGDRVAYDAPRWEPNFPRPEAAAGQFGWDARVAALAVPQRQAADGVPRAILAVLHPTVDPFMAWPGGGTDRPSVAAAMQGASLLNLERLGSGWVVVDGGYQTRRLHGGTLCRLSGPQAGGGSVQGLLGLQGGCTTPWGTLLLAEGDPAPWIARLGACRPALRLGWRLRLGGGTRPLRPRRRADQAHRPRPLRPRRRGGDPRPRRPRGGVHDRPAGQRLSPPLRVVGPGDRARRARRGNDLGGALRRRPARLAAGPARWRRRPGRGRFAARHPRRPRPGPDRAAAGALLPRQPRPAARLRAGDLGHGGRRRRPGRHRQDPLRRRPSVGRRPIRAGGGEAAARQRLAREPFGGRGGRPRARLDRHGPCRRGRRAGGRALSPATSTARAAACRCRSTARRGRGRSAARR